MSLEVMRSNEPASHPDIIDVLRRALERAYKFPVQSVSISLHMKDGGYYPEDAFPYGDTE